MAATCCSATTSLGCLPSCGCPRLPMPAEPLSRRIAALPESPLAAAALDRLREAAERQNLHDALTSTLADGTANFLGTAFGDCPFLLDLAAKDIARLAELLESPPQTRIESLTRS